MFLKNTVLNFALALAVAGTVVPISGAATAGGYGYGIHKGWNGAQAHTPKHPKRQGPSYAGSNRHLAWCYDRYRSYRLQDNTFQPYHGPRQECLSPFEQDRRTLFVGYPGQAPEILFRDQAVATVDASDRDSFGNLPEVSLTGGDTAAASAEPPAPKLEAPAKVPQLVVISPTEGDLVDAETSVEQAGAAGTPVVAAEAQEEGEQTDDVAGN